MNLSFSLPVNSYLLRIFPSFSQKSVIKIPSVSRVNWFNYPIARSPVFMSLLQLAVPYLKYSSFVHNIIASESPMQNSAIESLPVPTFGKLSPGEYRRRLALKIQHWALVEIEFPEPEQQSLPTCDTTQAIIQGCPKPHSSSWFFHWKCYRQKQVQSDSKMAKLISYIHEADSHQKCCSLVLQSPHPLRQTANLQR
jgi:hypothetical protein